MGEPRVCCNVGYIRKMLAPDPSISIVSLKKRGYILEVNKE